MDPKTTTRSASAVRTPLAGVSALLVFGLLLGVSLQGVKPTVGEPGGRREPAAERVALRQISTSLVKAARHLAGSDSHKPATTIATRTVTVEAGRAVPAASAADLRAPAPPLLRAAMLDLPPPTRRA